MRSAGAASLAALAHPAVGLLISATLGVAGGALAGLLLQVGASTDLRSVHSLFLRESESLLKQDMDWRAC